MVALEEIAMTDTTTWSWARLDERGLELLHEAERTLGADYVMVYAEGGRGATGPGAPGLRPAPLDDSQLECLQGLEAAVHGVAVAYRQA